MSSIATATSPIDIKGAISIALKHVADLFSQDPDALLFEEVEGDDDEWIVTVSMPARLSSPRPSTPLGQFLEQAALGGGRTGQREYKTITVRKSNGEVTDIKIRDLRTSMQRPAE